MTLTDQILEATLDLSEGKPVPPSLLPLVQSAVQGAQAHVQHFARYSDNPEMTPELARATEQALNYLLESLETLQSRLVNATGPDWKTCAFHLQAAMLEVRDQQQRHARRIDDGPTSNPFINRLILHIDSWLAGKMPGPSTVDLLQSKDSLDDLLNSYIESAQSDETIEKLEDIADGLLEICEDLSEAVARANPLHDIRPAGLVHWRYRLIDLSSRFDTILIDKLESELAEGPTPNPIINLLDKAIDQYIRTQLADAALQETLSKSFNALQMQLPLQLDTEQEEAAQALFAVLENLHRAAMERDRFSLREQRSALHQTAIALHRKILPPAPKDKQPSSGRMLFVLARLLWLIQDFRRGDCSRAKLRKAIINLGDLIAQAAQLLAHSQAQGGKRLQTQDALSSLSQLEMTLWEYLDDPKAFNLSDLQRKLETVDGKLKQL